MWFWHRKTPIKLSAPVRGHRVALPRDSRWLLAIRPTNTVVYAPLNGDVAALTSTSIRIVGLDGQSYRLTLSTPVGSFEWQVRVGDSVSPISLLGTLSSDLSRTAVIRCERLEAIPETANKHSRYVLNY